ncbi:hypothetical protein PIB30_101235 [Stylosanthes scabra]|uniref:Ribonuclease H1 N-terminal domain-containing protein n=1 Tax=Stylosanthes scabra TaxID=79078 RepID=A0ABU6WXB4_9FABA|nr:hypothetical protein [Stylosanthes scabra]
MDRQKYNYYAVRKGRVPEINTSLKKADKQVKGFCDCDFKGSSYRRDALKYLNRRDHRDVVDGHVTAVGSSSTDDPGSSFAAAANFGRITGFSVPFEDDSIERVANFDRLTEINTSWKKADKQVKGFCDCDFKGLMSRRDALKYLNRRDHREVVDGHVTAVGSSSAADPGSSFAAAGGN